MIAQPTLWARFAALGNKSNSQFPAVASFLASDDAIETVYILNPDKAP
jgi:hypothetical protein